MLNNDWKKITAIESTEDDNIVEITQEINLSHIDCPLIIITDTISDSY